MENLENVKKVCFGGVKVKMVIVVPIRSMMNACDLEILTVKLKDITIAIHV